MRIALLLFCIALISLDLNGRAAASQLRANLQSLVYRTEATIARTAAVAQQAVNAGPPAVLLLSANALVLPNDGGTAILTARVRDAVGNPVEGVFVAFHSTSGSTLPDSAPTNAEGFVTSTFTASGEPGQVIISARLNDLTQTEAIQVVNPNIDPSNHTLALDLGTNQLDPAQQLNVNATLRTGSGEPVAGELVSFFGSLGQMSPASAVSDENGRVAITYTAGNTAGRAMITVLSGVTAQSATFQVGNPDTDPQQPDKPDDDPQEPDTPDDDPQQPDTPDDDPQHAPSIFLPLIQNR